MLFMALAYAMRPSFATVRNEVRSVNCGSRPGAPVNVSDGMKKKCPQCAGCVQPDAKVCRFCGYKFESPISAVPTES